MIPNKETIQKLVQRYSEGTRVKLIKMSDNSAPPIGTLGTVLDIDSTGTIFVHWDNGSGLGVIYGEDDCEVVSSDEEKEMLQESLQVLVGQVMNQDCYSLYEQLQQIVQVSSVEIAAQDLFKGSLVRHDCWISTQSLDGNKQKMKILSIYVK